MKQWQKAIALLLAPALCLALAACQKAAAKAPAVTLDDFVGFWMYEDIDVAVTINEDGSWYYDWMDADIENHEGTAAVRDGLLELEEDGEVYVLLTRVDANPLSDEDEDILRRTDPADAPEGSAPAVGDFYGAWKYDAYDNIVVIKEDGTWDQYGAGDTYQGNFYYTFENGAVTLQNSELEPFLSLTPSGQQLVDSDGDALSPYALPAAAAAGGLDQTAYPAAEDALSETGTLPDCSPAVTFLYPASLRYSTEAEHPLRFCSRPRGRIPPPRSLPTAP